MENGRGPVRDAGKKRTIVVTDGDCRALEAVEAAARNVGGRCISISGCRNPSDTHWSPEDVEELILSATWDPVVVLVDDEGARGEGWGERTLRHLVGSENILVLGVVAVASGLRDAIGARVTVSVDEKGNIADRAVNKDGEPQDSETVRGDTVENLDGLMIPIVVGMGDPGKMNFADDARKGAPITTKALQYILEYTAPKLTTQRRSQGREVLAPSSNCRKCCSKR